MKYITILLIFLSVTSQAQRFGKTLKETPGIVSYTYRNSFQKDIAATLDTIQRLGITNIEFSNLFGRTAKEIRTLLDERKMRCTSFGVQYVDLVTKTYEVAQNAKTLGASFVRVAWIPHEGDFTMDHLKKAIEDFNNRPHHVLSGLTPLEALNGKTIDKNYNSKQMQLAKAERITENKQQKCCGYSF